jgi:DNA-binding transcriptional regulator GbsR (MarR family)
MDYDEMEMEISEQEILNLFEERAEIYGAGTYTVGEISEMLGTGYMNTSRLLIKMVETGKLYTGERRTNGLSTYGVIAAASDARSQDGEAG